MSLASLLPRCGPARRDVELGPDLLIRNARIWTGTSATLWSSTTLLREGTFAFVGEEHELSVPPGCRILDLGGKLAVPGLVDGHVHLLGTGAAMRSVDLKGVASVGEALRRVAARAKAMPAEAWIFGAGWDQHLWPRATFPDRHALDGVSLGHPVLLTHTSGHCIWVNSAALRAAGVTSATSTPTGGAIDLGEDGEPNGILRDAAAELVGRAAPAPTDDERMAMLRDAVAHAHRLGVTGVHAMDVRRGEWRAMQALHAENSLRIRTRAFLAAPHLDGWIEEGLRTGTGDEMLRIGGVKFFADGALGSMTAWMLQPYEGSDDCGLPLQPVFELESRVRAALESGLAPAIHAIGDRANREVLGVLERAHSISPHLPRRIEHAQLLAPGDVERFARLGVTASVQPIHATQDMTKVDRAWGVRGRGAYLFATLLRSGANVAFGSDSPVEAMDPLAGIHAAATRRSRVGTPANGWYPDERISVEEAVRAYTVGCATASRDQHAGRVAPGCYGDITVLSDDIITADDPMRILETRVEMTMVDGEIVYQRG